MQQKKQKQLCLSSCVGVAGSWNMCVVVGLDRNGGGNQAMQRQQAF